ncbi:MAG: DUF177 domain-containing protein [Desulfovibrio sp.]|jgi:uncharacterized protein|nr:DUF177 domain-containing protein [Desulfovibrio sp.]
MLIPINELPPEGARFCLDDQSLWMLPIADFGMACTISKPLAASVTVIPSEEGCLVRGRLTGAVVVPCNRCAEDTPVSLAADFEEFESLPPAAGQGGGGDSGEESRIVMRDDLPVLDLGAICWEEFLLALPFAPLCRVDCKGVCPTCGANLNNGGCACSPAEPDPRLAALRNLKIR